MSNSAVTSHWRSRSSITTALPLASWEAHVRSMKGSVPHTFTAGNRPWSGDLALGFQSPTVRRLGRANGRARDTGWTSRTCWSVSFVKGSRDAVSQGTMTCYVSIVSKRPARDFFRAHIFNSLFPLRCGLVPRCLLRTGSGVPGT